jgi:hypothetical protein
VQRFSSEGERRFVFDPLGDKARAPKVQTGDWIDLYQVLEIAPNASTSELDEKIIERGADAVYFAFSKNGKPAHISQLEKHLPEMRPILLDAATRERYDEQLNWHKNGDPRAMKYEAFLQTLDVREYSGCLSVLLLISLPILSWWLASAA